MEVLLNITIFALAWALGSWMQEGTRTRISMNAGFAGLFAAFSVFASTVQWRVWWLTWTTVLIVVAHQHVKYRRQRRIVCVTFGHDYRLVPLLWKPVLASGDWLECERCHWHMRVEAT